jgi:hypothetical protein
MDALGRVPYEDEPGLERRSRSHVRCSVLAAETSSDIPAHWRIQARPPVR